MRLIATTLLAAFVLSGQNPSAWEGLLKQGIAAFENARYDEALSAFRRAAELNSNSAIVHLHLGETYAAICIPGAQTPGNRANEANAESEFHRVLLIDPANSVALESLATLLFNEASGLAGEDKMRKLEEAREWYRRLTLAEPNDKEAHYSLGVIAWAEWYPADMTARVQVKMRPEDPGPLPSPVREQLRARFEAVVDDGISELERALTIDPEYDDAIAYLNLLLRERADIDSAEQASEDYALADEWVQKVLEIKNAKAAAACGGNCAPPAAASPAFRVPTLEAIDGTDPSCPETAIEARIDDAVRFDVAISENGSVTDLRLISGPALLADPAAKAIRGWKFHPVFQNGRPVSAIGAVEVGMDCRK